MRINIPPVTRVLLAAAIALSFLYTVARWGPSFSGPDGGDIAQSKRLVPFLALVPARFLYNPWTIATSTFVEQNIVTLLVNGAAIFFGGKYLERAWGSKDFAMVIAVATLIPNTLMIPTYFIWGAIMGNVSRTSTPITGAITLQAAFLVAFKQLVPEHTVSIYKGMIKMRVKHFPAIFLLLNTLSGFVIGTDTALFLAWYGLITTWVYLRFFKRQPDLSGTSTEGGLRGDASETFAFATFFPNVLQPVIAPFCDQIYIILCNSKIITPFSDEAIASGNEQAAARGEAGLPSVMNPARGARVLGKQEEAERRRALALKALDQRLHAAENRPAVATTLEGDGQGS